MKELTKNALKVCEKRYFHSDDERNDPQLMWRRVAKHVSQAELHYSDPITETDKDNQKRYEEEFYQILSNLEFIPNSPTIHGAGVPNTCLSACFVIPIEDSMEGIFNALRQSAIIHQHGGGTGFSFTNIRPKHSNVGLREGAAGGPLSFMEIFDKSADAVTQTGLRKGANMGILRVDHPDIFEFIRAKKDHNRLNNFNLSVAITDEFMEALENDSDFLLAGRNHNTTIETIKARDLWNEITQLAWEGGDPGIFFIDKANDTSPFLDLEIEATNPCGEVPMPAFQSCNLGSIDVSKFVAYETEGNMGPGGNGPFLDEQGLVDVIRTAVRFLDNIITVNYYPIPEIEEATKAYRKIGLGIMGFADLLIKLGISYSSPKAITTARDLMEFVNTEAEKASNELAKERGAFPEWGATKYYSATKLPAEGPPLPIPRNVTRTVIAPTGTISILAGCSSGIEPIFAIAYENIMVNPEDSSITKLPTVHPLFEEIARAEGFYSDQLIDDIIEAGTIQDHPDIPSTIKKLFQTAHDIKPSQHIAIQAAFQAHTNDAASKTINMPNSATVQDIKDIYMEAYNTGCKGVTIFRDGCRDIQALTKSTKDTKPTDTTSTIEETLEKANVKFNDNSSNAEYEEDQEPLDRPTVLAGETISVETGCGAMYVTVNDHPHQAEPYEMICTLGKAGGCAASQSEAIGRLISLCLQNGIPSEDVIKRLVGIMCSKPVGFGQNKINSCADAIGKALQTRLYRLTNGDTKPEKTNGSPLTPPRLSSAEGSVNVGQGACPDCGGPLEKEGGCEVCHSCGASACG